LRTKETQKEGKMKERMLIAMVLVLVVILALPLVTHGQEPDPAAVVLAEAERVNAGDIDGVMELYADDAVVTLVMGPDTITLTGKEEIRPWLEDLMAGNFRLEYEVVSVEGDTVTLTARTWHDDTVALGIAPVIATEVATVRDGKIQAFTWTMSDESLAAWGAALAALPETGGVAFPIQAVMVGLGGLAVAGGLGLERLRRRWIQAYMGQTGTDLSSHQPRNGEGADGR
jgi:ketosteroid isomerase-like protein